ncbi:MAG: hypothetical protein K6F20_01485 [Bacteroidaceae bacterium]|nr:hypothetical protein [Bacteroidaceae bacterium]
MEEIKNLQDQLAKIDVLDSRLRAILFDLSLLRKSLEASNSNIDVSPAAKDDLLETVYQKLRKRKASRSNFRSFCKANSVNTLEDFIKYKPSTFLRFKGIGPKTLTDVREAIESLGVVWSDAQ